MAVPLQYDVCQKEVAGDPAESSQPPTHKWYFSRQEIEFHTPSRYDGIDYELEEHLRKLYSSFLQELGMELEVPQVTIAIAMMFCHRFYMRQSHAKNDWQTVATACMFLACKAEETPRWLKKLVEVAYPLIFKWDPSASMRIQEKEIHDKQKELILIGERLLLHVLAFDLNIELPYKSLVAAIKRLGSTYKDLSKVAWNFVNDWLHTSLCLQHKPHYIAASCLFFAAKVLKVKLPTSKGKTWWMEFEVSPKQLEDVIQQMMKLWEHSQSQSQGQGQGQSLASKNQTVAEPPIRKATTTITNCEKKVAFEKVQDTSRETTKSQTSDTGSGVSVVEDGDIGEPVTVKSDLSSSCKIVSVGGMLGNKQVLDVNKIKEKLKKRNLIKTMKRKHVEEDMNDGEDWIERELENGIVLQSTYPEKQRKI